jgi:uroporphyrinogen-III synthase
VTQPLDGATLLVTRPAAQAARFTALAEAAGARCIALPTLVIEPVTLPSQAAAAIRGQAWDWALWTSTNAVEFGLAALPGLRANRHAAVGRATAGALQAHGLAVALRPEQANSEGLLAMPALQAVAGRQVLLVKGEGGRDLLHDTLVARGAQVTSAAVYRRVPARPSPVELQAVRDALPSRPLVVVTSGEVLASLVAIARAAQLDRFEELPLVVPGRRVYDAAGGLGWRGPVTVASTAEDAAMLEAAAAARGGESPGA